MLPVDPSAAAFLANYLSCEVNLLQEHYKEASQYCYNAFKIKPNPLLLEDLINLAYKTKNKNLLKELISFLSQGEIKKREPYLSEAKALLCLLEGKNSCFVESAERAFIYGSRNRVLIGEALKNGAFLKDWKFTTLTALAVYSLNPKGEKNEIIENLIKASFALKPKEAKKLLDSLKFENEYIDLLAAQVFLYLNRLNEAFQYAQRALKLNPNFKEAKKLLIELYLLEGKKKKALSLAEGDGNLKLFLYKELFGDFPFLADRKLFYEAVKEFPENRELTETLLTFSLTQRWKEGILKSGKLYLKNGGKNPALLAGYFLTELKVYRDIEERNKFKKLLKEYPQNADLKLVEAFRYFTRCQLPKTKELLNKIHPRELTKLYTYLYTALKIYLACKEGKQWKKKITTLPPKVYIKSLYEAYDISPRFADSFAQIYLQNSTNATLYGLTFITFSELGDLKAQERVLKEAAERFPNEPTFLNSLGYTYLLLYGKEKIQEAKNLIEKALQIDPNDGATMDSLGWAYYLEGNLKEAKRWIEKALQKVPEDPVVNYHMGEVLLKLNLPCRAKFYLEESLKGVEKSFREPEEGLEKRVYKALYRACEECQNSKR